MAKNEQLDSLLVDYLDGNLDNGGKADVKNRLAHDPALSKELGEIKRVMEFLGDLPKLGPPANLLEKINSGIEKHEAALTDEVDRIIEKGKEPSTEFEELSQELVDVSKTVKLLNKIPTVSPPPEMIKGILAHTNPFKPVWQRAFDFLFPGRQAPWTSLAVGLAACTLLIVLLTVPKASFKTASIKQNESPISMNKLPAGSKSASKPTTMFFKEKHKDVKGPASKLEGKIEANGKIGGEPDKTAFSFEASALGKEERERESKITVIGNREHAGNILETAQPELLAGTGNTRDGDLILRDIEENEDKGAALPAKESKALRTESGKDSFGTTIEKAKMDKAGEDRRSDRYNNGLPLRTTLSANEPTVTDSLDEEDRFETDLKERESSGVAFGGAAMATGEGRASGAKGVGGNKILSRQAPLGDSGDTLSPDLTDAPDDGIVMEEETGKAAGSFRKAKNRGVGKASSLVIEKDEDGNITKLMISKRYEGVHSGVHERKFVKIHTKTGFVSLWKNIYSNMVPAPKPPNIDFNSYFVIAAFMGEKSSSGHRTSIRKVDYVNSIVRVQVSSSSPPENSSMLTVMTQPFSLVVVKIPDGVSITSKTPVNFY